MLTPLPKRQIKDISIKKYFSIAEKIFNGIKSNLIKNDKDGLPDLYDTISSAGLGGHPYLDGTFSYYINEPKRKNDFKKLDPLISAAYELQSPSQLVKKIFNDW